MLAGPVTPQTYSPPDVKSSKETIMGRKSLLICVAALVMTGVALAIEHKVTIKKVDADQGILVVHSNDRDRPVPVAKGVKVVATDGTDLPDGLRSKALTEGAAATITVEKDGNKQVITAVRLTKGDGG